MITDEKVGLLEAEVVGQKAKPDKRKRWTRQVIERMRVAERAARIIISLPRKEWSRFDPDVDEIWHDAQQKAITELRGEGKIRG